VDEPHETDESFLIQFFPHFLKYLGQVDVLRVQIHPQVGYNESNLCRTFFCFLEVGFELCAE